MSVVANKVAPYGTWRSPITADIVAEKSISCEDILVDPTTSTVYHIELRPNEGGRSVIVRSVDGVDVFGKQWNARTRVQEYGGASAIVYNETIYFSNFDDGRLYKVDLREQNGGHGDPVPISPVNLNHRFADFAVNPRFPHFVVCILEDHTDVSSPQDAVTSLVVIDTRGDSDVRSSQTSNVKPTTPRPFKLVTLVHGADFYSTPRFNEDGTVLAWSQWFHPDMPWDGGEVHVSAVEVMGDCLHLQQNASQESRLAGKAAAIGAVQPTWMGTDTLLFCCDASGYQNPWISKLITASTELGSPFTVDTSPILSKPITQDFADPSWLFGTSNFAVLSKHTGSVVFAAWKDGRSVLYVINVNGSDAGDVTEIPSPFVHVHRMRSVSPGTIAFIGSKADEGAALVICSISDTNTLSYTVISADSTKHSSGYRKDSTGSNLNPAIPPSLISRPQPISLLVPNPLFNNLQNDAPESLPLHVVFYPPTNPAYAGPENESEKPPAVVNVHGGPTRIAFQGLDLTKQFFTSRGWAWIDVNYAGSSGYGRKYTERLAGRWGIGDVQDCVQAAVQLSSPQYALIDAKRVVIRGGSAGGYTTLSTLCQTDVNLQVFAAGTLSYGISDLRKLVESTHKYQSRYMERLLGGRYKDIPEVYRDRSPVFHARNIKVPLLILQGSVDPIVTPAQADDIVKSIKERDQGVRPEVDYVVFEGESHGWRQSNHIAIALEKEITFYKRVLMIRDV